MDEDKKAFRERMTGDPFDFDVKDKDGNPLDPAGKSVEDVGKGKENEGKREVQ
jgi:hypothetical protein